MSKYIYDYLYEYLERFSKSLDFEQLLLNCKILIALSLFFYIFNIAYFFLSGKNFFKIQLLIFRLNRYFFHVAFILFLIILKAESIGMNMTNITGVVFLQFIFSILSLATSIYIALRKWR